MLPPDRAACTSPDCAARPRRSRDLTAGLHQIIMKNAVDVGRNPLHLRTPPKSMVLRMDPWVGFPPPRRGLHVAPRIVPPVPTVKRMGSVLPEHAT